MPRGKDKRRARFQANAAPARARPDLVGYTMEGSTIMTPYVPAGVIYRKKAEKHGMLSARRAHMKALMSMKSGTTGYGCVMGCHAIITYPISEEEKSLMESMVYGADDVNGGWSGRCWYRLRSLSDDIKSGAVLLSIVLHWVVIVTSFMSMFFLVVMLDGHVRDNFNPLVVFSDGK